MCPLPRAKVGRNDPCPCGSGKKHKHCCLRTEWAEPLPADTPWSRQREASDRLTPALLKLAAREFGDYALLAWADFNQLPNPEPLSKYPYEEAIFSPYAIFDWTPEGNTGRRSGKPKLGAIASSYLDKNFSRLSELELLILSQACSQPTTFYEIIRANPGHSVVLRDVLLGGDTEVEEHSGSKTMRPGDLLYAQIWKLPEVATLGRLAPRPISPDKKVGILNLREKLRRKIAKKNRELNASDLLRYSEEIRTVYLDIRDAMFAPKTLTNTDGELFAFYTLTFRIGSAQLALDALAPLAFGFAKDELIQDAQWNADGSLHSVEFNWLGKGNKMHKEWDNTVLGRLVISANTLVVEVNSANRAKTIREQIEKRLGLHATHLSTTSETPEDALAKRKDADAVRRSDAAADRGLDSRKNSRAGRSHTPSGRRRPGWQRDGSGPHPRLGTPIGNPGPSRRVLSPRLRCPSPHAQPSRRHRNRHPLSPVRVIPGDKDHRLACDPANSLTCHARRAGANSPSQSGVIPRTG